MPARARARGAQASGFSLVDGLFDETSLACLREEAFAGLAHAVEHDVAVDGAGNWGGGAPARRLCSATGGPVQTGLFHAPGLAAFTGDWAGVGLRPSGARGTYSYYLRDGDFLGLHRDVGLCSIAIITCLHVEGILGGDAGALCLYPTRNREALSSIRDAPARGRVHLDLAPGQSIIMDGAHVAHALLPLARGQARVVSILCFTHAGERARRQPGRLAPSMLVE